MSWITFIWSVDAGICLTLAGMHLMVWVRSRNNWSYLLFSVAAMGAAGCAVVELAMMYSQTPVQYGHALRWWQLPAQIMIVSLVWFVRRYLHAGRLWLAWLVSGLRGVWLVLSFWSDPNLNFRTITGLKQLSVWGQTIVIAAIGEKHPWTNINNVGTLLFLFFVLDACVAAWRQGERRRVVGAGGPIALAIALGIVQSILLVRGMMPMPASLSFLFLIIIMGISYQLSDDLLRANEIARKLQETEARMQLAASAANLGMWEWDVDRNIFWLNETIRARMGAGESEPLTFERMLQFIHPEDREQIRRGAYLSIEEGRMFDSECRINIPEGSTRWLSLKGQVARSLNGKSAIARGVTMDITLRKKIQVALENSAARLKEAQRLAHIGNWKLDLLSDELSWSEEVFRIFEIDPDRFGASYAFFRSVIHPEDRDAVNAAYTQSLETRTPYSINYRLLMPDGRIKCVHEQCETIYDTDGNPLQSVGTVQDITERQQATNEKIRLRNELAHLNRIMTIGELSHSLAHEINQPLGAIMNNAAAAKSITANTGQGNDDLKEILEDIIKDTNRAGQIIRKIRGMVKKEETQLEFLNMESIITEVVDLFKNAFSIDHISLQLDFHPDLPPIRGDRVRLQQVLTNLISNAMEAMGTAASKNLTIRSAMQSPDTITVSVSDSGAGIDKEIEDKIFQPFFTTKKGGLGIGLRLCRSIIEEHGGRIWMENDPQGGATFFFSLKTTQGDSP